MLDQNRYLIFFPHEHPPNGNPAYAHANKTCSYEAIWTRLCMDIILTKILMISFICLRFKMVAIYKFQIQIKIAFISEFDTHKVLIKWQPFKELKLKEMQL